MSTKVTVQFDGALTDWQSTVAMTPANSITFGVTDVPAFLLFGTETAAALTPSPTNPVALASGTSVTYTFNPASPGLYQVVAVNNLTHAPAEIDFDSSGDRAILLITATGGRNAPDETTSSGT